MIDYVSHLLFDVVRFYPSQILKRTYFERSDAHHDYFTKLPGILRFWYVLVVLVMFGGLSGSCGSSFSALQVFLPLIPPFCSRRPFFCEAPVDVLPAKCQHLSWTLFPPERIILLDHPKRFIPKPLCLDKSDLLSIWIDFGKHFETSSNLSCGTSYSPLPENCVGNLADLAIDALCPSLRQHANPNIAWNNNPEEQGELCTHQG